MAADEEIPSNRETRTRIDHRTGKRVFIHDASFWQAHVASVRGSGNRCTRTARSAVLR